jgi:hypothetical protein
MSQNPHLRTNVREGVIFRMRFTILAHTLRELNPVQEKIPCRRTKMAALLASGVPSQQQKIRPEAQGAAPVDDPAHRPWRQAAAGRKRRTFRPSGAGDRDAGEAQPEEGARNALHTIRVNEDFVYRSTPNRRSVWQAARNWRKSAPSLPIHLRRILLP